jgi:ParB-like chromosome segregation protein Spo0J
MATTRAFGFQWMPDHEVEPVAARWMNAKRRGVRRREQIPLTKLRSYQVALPRKLAVLMKAMQEGLAIPPILVVKHEGYFEIVDGVHRCHAARLLGRETIEAWLLE